MGRLASLSLVAALALFLLVASVAGRQLKQDELPVTGAPPLKRVAGLTPEVVSPTLFGLPANSQDCPA